MARVSLVLESVLRSGMVGTDVKGWGKMGGMFRAPSGYSSLVGEEEWRTTMSSVWMLSWIVVIRIGLDNCWVSK